MPESSTEAAGAASQAARDDVLELTSRLRGDIDGLAEDPPMAIAFDPLLQTGRDLTRCLARNRLEILVDGGEALEQMAGLAKTLAPDQPEAARAILVGLGRAVGVLEQSLDAVLEDAGAERLDSLGEALLGAFPEPWSSYLDEQTPSADASNAAGEAARAEPFDAASASEQDILETFEAEASDALTGCEALALRGEEEGFGPDLLSGLDRELALIEEAAGATDLSEAASILATGRELIAEAGESPLPDERLADAVLGVLDAARAIIAQSCGRATRSWLEVDALSAEQWSRLDRARDGEIAEDPATRPFERLFRRLRQPLRGRVRIEIESTPEELRIERAVGERIEGALLQMIRGALPETPAGSGYDPVARIQVQAERIGDSTLVVTMEDDEAPDDDDVPAIDRHVGEASAGPTSKPETLHWIDATKEVGERDLERLVYRPGFSNVVQILVSPKALRRTAGGGAP